MVQDKEREQLQVQLQQQLQTSEEHVQELKSRLEKQEMATRDLKAENKSLSKSATESKVHNSSCVACYYLEGVLHVSTWFPRNLGTKNCLHWDKVGVYTYRCTGSWQLHPEQQDGVWITVLLTS